MELVSQIPIGQYVPGTSYLHRLDPRTKIVFVFLYVILVFVAKDLVAFTVLTGCLCVAIILSRLRVMYLLKALKPMVWIIGITVLIHLLSTKGGAVVFAWGPISIEEEGVEQAVTVSVRLTLLLLMASLMTLTTSPIDLTDGLERLLAPFSRIGLPAHEIALMMSITLRFIPTLIEETEKIMKAQASRGADFESGNIIRRSKALLPILIPLFLSAFRRAEELALAMEARGYRGAAGRTKLRELRFTGHDGVVCICTIVLLSFMITWRWAVNGHG